MIPTTLAHYRIIRLLSSGGMGEVYLAEDSKLARMVALKVIAAEASPNSHASGARLMKEARAAAKLDHPNVCQIFEVGGCERGPYIAMQFVDGETLSALLQRSRPTLEEILSWGIQACDALGEAHALGIVHRDIKPANLMRTPRGQIKVLDFGLAKVTARGPRWNEASQVLTTPGLVMGTIPYMSPEQVRGEVLDGRSDLFSLGAILFEAATGQRPFQAANSADLMSDILRTDPFATPLPEGLAPELRPILVHALQKDRNLRYPTAQAMADDLRALYARVRGDSGPLFWPLPSSGPYEATQRVGASGDLPTSLHPSRPAPRPLRRRLRPWMVAAGALALLAPAAAVLAPRVFARAETIDSIAILPIAFPPGDAEAEVMAEGLAEQLIAHLARAPHLKVIAQSSVRRYRGQDSDLRAVARELGVKSVLVGRLRREGDQLALSVELVEVASQRQLLGERYHGGPLDLLAMEERLLHDLGQRALTPLQAAAAPATAKVSGEAFDLYLRAKKALGTASLDGIQQAFGFLDEALRRSPGFAQAHAAKAYGYLLMGNQYMASAESAAHIQQEAERALELDPRNPEAHSLLALALANLHFDFKGAEQRYRRAIELAPGSAGAHEMYGYFLSAMGRREESAREMDRAVELDPLSASVHRTRAVTLVMARHWDQALAAARHSQELEPNNAFCDLLTARVYGAQGHWKAMMEQLDRVPGKSGIQFVLRGIALARLGHREEAKAIANTFSDGNPEDQHPKACFQAALIHVALGERRQAIALLRRAEERRESPVLFLPVDPWLDDLRDEPEFAALLNHVSAGRITSK